MYKNIKAEQARRGVTDQDVADYLGISRKTYGKKIHDGNWNDVQAKKLCQYFQKSFDYLFQNED